MYVQRIEGVMERLEKANLKLKPSKCHFFQKQVKYIVSNKGVATDPAKIQAMAEWEIPTE